MLTARQIKANPSDAAHYIKQVLVENAKLREALLNIVYLDKGRWFIGIHGDCRRDRNHWRNIEGLARWQTRR